MYTGTGTQLDTPCIPRKRRFPYTTVACDTCKRRKTKCSGERPCQGCRDVNAACVYKRTTRFRSGSRSSFSSSSGLHVLEASRPTGRGGNGQRAPPPSQPAADSDPDRRQTTASTAAGPTSVGPANSDYYLGVAQRHLAAAHSGHESTRQRPRCPAVDGPRELRKLISHRLGGSPGGVLAALSPECWADVLLTYDEEIGLQYPFLDMDELQRDIGQAARQRADGHAPRRDQIADIATLILAVVAIFTDSDSAAIADALVQDIFTGTIARTHLTGGDRHSLSLVTLTSIYFFLTDREVLAWRGIGAVSRLLQELRSHSSDDAPHRTTSTAPPPAADKVSDKMYWAVYTLDRRWSFGTGLPFAIQDADVRHGPRFRDGSLSALYLEHMVAYCGITSEVRRWCLEGSPPAASSAMCDLLCFRVFLWQRNLPAQLQFRGLQDVFDPARESRGAYKIRLTLYLRANQMHTIIYRRAAVRPGSRDFDASHANVMAATAQDTVRLLARLARDTDIYRSQQKTFNHFLETALSSLLLILCCSADPAGHDCLHDVLAAMDLVRRLSAHSSVSRRLQHKLQTFQAVVDDLRTQAQHAGTAHRSSGHLDDPPPPPLAVSASASAFPGFGPADAFHGPLANALSSVPSQPALPLQTTPPCYTLPTVASSVEASPSQVSPTGLALPLQYAASSAVDCGAGDLPLFRFPELTDYLMGFESNLFM